MLVGERNLRVWPAPQVEKECITGIIPIDFFVERLIETGIEWFRNNPKAPNEVFGHLKDAFLNDKYGQIKIDEIAEYVKRTEIDVKQAFPIEDEESPSISINLQSSAEISNLTGLDDYAGSMNALGSDGTVMGTTQQGYTPIRDEVLIGIHATSSPDKTKYLYYLVTYIINAFRDQLEERPGKVNGLFNITWRATDISRLNEYLPAHMFSRFVTLTADHFAIFNKAVQIPFIEGFQVRTDLSDGEGNIEEGPC